LSLGKNCGQDQQSQKLSFVGFHGWGHFQNAVRYQQFIRIRILNGCRNALITGMKREALQFPACLPKRDPSRSECSQCGGGGSRAHDIDGANERYNGSAEARLQPMTKPDHQEPGSKRSCKLRSTR
jgi:hypothetical protein